MGRRQSRLCYLCPCSRLLLPPIHRLYRLTPCNASGCRARERRRQQEKLAATKTLGEADEDVDDVMAWVGKSRT